MYIFKIHSETSLSFNLPNFLPQSHSQLMTCFIFLQIQNNEKRISINPPPPPHLANKHLCQAILPPILAPQSRSVWAPLCSCIKLLPLFYTRSPPLQCSSLFPVLSFSPLQCIMPTRIQTNRNLPYLEKIKSKTFSWLTSSSGYHSLYIFPFTAELAEELFILFPVPLVIYCFETTPTELSFPPWLHQNRCS